MSEHRRLDSYFDTEPPSPPEEIFGFATLPALELCQAMQGLRSVSRKLGADGETLEGMVEIFPLLDKVQSGVAVSRHDVRPYRRAIKKAVPLLEEVDDVMTKLTVIPPIGMVGRIALNLGIEAEFVKQVPYAVSRARTYIPRVEPYVKLFASYENPNKQLKSELGVINDMIIEAILSKSTEPGPNDAAEVLIGLFETVLNGGKMSKKFELIDSCIDIKRQRSGHISLLSKTKLTAITAEILTLLNAPFSPNSKAEQIIESVKQKTAESPQASPITKKDDLEALRQSAPIFLPAILSLLPTSGEECKRRFNEVKKFLAAPGE